MKKTAAAALFAAGFVFANPAPGICSGCADHASAVGPSRPLAKLPHMLLAQGAIKIKLGAEAIGAIGVGGAPGGDLDEACAKAGLDKISGRLK
jgi:uncharacterized protein GlcG (DUF336 family)